MQDSSNEGNLLKREILEFLLLAGSISVLTYGIIYLLLGLLLPAAIEFIFLVFCVLAMLWLRRSDQYHPGFVLMLAVGVCAVVTGITLSLGGIIPSGAFVIWLYLIPMSGMIFLVGWPRLLMVLLPGVLLIGLLILGDIPPLAVLPAYLRPWALVMNILSAGGVLLGTLHLFHLRMERQEGALRESEHRYRATIEHSSVAVALKDQEGRYLLVNPRFEDLLGLRAEQVIGRKDTDLFHERQLRVFAPLEEKLRDRGVPQEAEEEVEIQGANKVLFSTRFSLPWSSGSERIFAWIIMDVTFRKELQEECARNQRLDALTMLAGGIAHDFNNLLMACLGNLALAQTRPLDDSALLHVQRAERALERATGLTRQLLAFAKGGSPIREPTSIEETVRESSSFILHGSKVRLECSFAPNLPIVEADLGQIGQLVQNLVLNATQAMSEGGLLRVGCEPWLEQGETPGLRAGRVYVRIRVEDEGPGIHDCHLARIFDPFFTTRPGGHGLGLPTCLAIARNHEGTIRVHSEVGKGTIFDVFLPASSLRARSSIAVETPGTIRERGPLRVLVMDDEPEVREVLSSLLENLGHETLLVASGEDAIRAWCVAREQGRDFDVLLLDLTIPGGLGGVETLSRLLALDPEVHAIAASGYSEDPAIREFRDHGFKESLRKPFRPEELERVLAPILKSPTRAPRDLEVL